MTPDRVHGPHAQAATAGGRAALGALATSKLFFFGAAGLSFLLSVFLFFSGDRERGIFVGIWVPSILSAGTLLIAESRRE
jgi:hypothetical protein